MYGRLSLGLCDLDLALRYISVMGSSITFAQFSRSLALGVFYPALLCFRVWPLIEFDCVLEQSV